VFVIWLGLSDLLDHHSDCGLVLSFSFEKCDGVKLLDSAMEYQLNYISPFILFYR